ncbi:hypothetical protein E5Q_03734 [Mixia osmundae IAM 14324]|uniref:C2H2-type domain-containing protein n=1 Tax=Mixia osmundae (strain CBS 9802 / IAM 14324 / JCM 22182 / KY 12970) TaxID=764103 RepID=G7E2J8_MIXOS|nr:hypothetical protein E5Q_03734 [Mixia osmundae IAM 14324]
MLTPPSRNSFNGCSGEQQQAMATGVASSSRATVEKQLEAAQAYADSLASENKLLRDLLEEHAIEAAKVQQKQDQLEISLASYKHQAESVPALEAKLSQLVDIHQTSKEKRQAEAAQLTTQLSTSKARILALQQQSQTDAEQIKNHAEQIASNNQSWQCERAELERIVAESQADKETLTRFVHTITHAAAEQIDSLREKARIAADGATAQAIASTEENARLHRKLSVRETQVELLDALLATGQEDLDRLEDELERMSSWHANVIAELVDARRSECLSVQYQEAEWQTRIADLQQERDHFAHILSSDRNAAAQTEAADEARLAVANRELLRVSAQASQDARELAELREELSRVENQNIDLATSLASAQNTLVQVQAKLEASEAAVRTEKSERSIDLETYQAEIESMHVEKQQAETEAAKDADARRKMTTLLHTSRANETAAREELERAETIIADLQRYEHDYQELHALVGDLARRKALAEGESQQLAELNNALLSHGNNQQKIKHVERIRQELREVKLHNLELTNQLAEAQHALTTRRDDPTAIKTMNKLQESSMQAPRAALHDESNNAARPSLPAPRRSMVPRASVRGRMSYYLALVGTRDNPLYEITLQSSKAPPATVPPPSQSAASLFAAFEQDTRRSTSIDTDDKTSTYQLGPQPNAVGFGNRMARHVMQITAYSALDALEDVQMSNGNMYFKSFDRFYEWTVSGWLSPGGLRIMLLHDIRNDDGIRLFLHETWELYTKILLNPFHELDSPVKHHLLDDRASQFGDAAIAECLTHICTANAARLCLSSRPMLAQTLTHWSPEKKRTGCLSPILIDVKRSEPATMSGSSAEFAIERSVSLFVLCHLISSSLLSPLASSSAALAQLSMDVLELVHEDMSDRSKRPHACDWDNCDRAFSRKSDLIRHERIHRNIRPFKCTIKGCPKAFIQQSALKVHLRVHSGERPHVCEWRGCTKAFGDSSSLARHRRVHTGQRPYRCRVEGCGKTFCRKVTLTKHIKRTHSDEDLAEATSMSVPSTSRRRPSRIVRRRRAKSETPSSDEFDDAMSESEPDSDSEGSYQSFKSESAPSPESSFSSNDGDLSEAERINTPQRRQLPTLVGSESPSTARSHRSMGSNMSDHGQTTQFITLPPLPAPPAFMNHAYQSYAPAPLQLVQQSVRPCDQTSGINLDPTPTTLAFQTFMQSGAGAVRSPVQQTFASQWSVSPIRPGFSPVRPGFSPIRAGFSAFEGLTHARTPSQDFLRSRVPSGDFHARTSSHALHMRAASFEFGYPSNTLGAFGSEDYRLPTIPDF